MNWWKILKNAKVSGKATGKGKSFDASKIKINIDKDDCCEEFWKTIQEFKNEHIIIVNVMLRHLSNPKYTKHRTFDGIGHIKHKGDTLISPMSSKEPCIDSQGYYSALRDIHVAFLIQGHPKEWDKYKYEGNMYPFLPKHYEDATISEIREWPILVDKFLEAFDELKRKYLDCEKIRD